MGRLMDINELASYLKLEKQTIYNWLYKKKISGIKIGHIWRFDKEVVDKWLESKVINAEQAKKNSVK
jgi:excisionase family DNA binding protein